MFLQPAKKAKSKQPSARKSTQKRKSKGGSDADETQGTLFDIVKAGKGALRVCMPVCTVTVMIRDRRTEIQLTHRLYNKHISK